MPAWVDFAHPRGICIIPEVLSHEKRTEKVISNYLFEVFRALVRSVEWSGVWG